MKGSVRQRGKTWYYRIDLGKVDEKRNQIEKGGFTTQKAAAKAMNDVIYHYNNSGEYIEDQKVTFQENFEHFMSVEAPATRAYATIQKYESVFKNHLKKEFGPSYLFQIRADRIEEFLHLKSTTYSEQFTKTMYKSLNVLFAYAFKRKLIKKNPMVDVRPPPDPRHVGEIKIYSPEERKLIQARISSTNVQTAYFIGINTGVRVSECFALQWSDVNFEQKTIKIRKQMRFQDRKWCFTPLKTKNSYREIDVPARFIEYLQKLKAEQENRKRLYGEAYQGVNVVWDRREHNQDDKVEIQDFINIKQNGKMMTSDSEKFMARIIKNDCGIHFKYHNLRHTYATLLAESGISPRYVQEQLGHAKLEFTLQYYTHVTDEMRQKAMESVANHLDIPIDIVTELEEDDPQNERGSADQEKMSESD